MAGASSGGLVAAARAFIDEQITSTLEKYEEKGIKAVDAAQKKIRPDIIEEWFGAFNSASTIATDQYDVQSSGVKKLSANKYSIQILGNSWNDRDSFTPGTASILKWEERHETDIGGYGFIFDQFFEEAHIGLPQWFSWVGRWNTGRFVDRGRNLTAELTDPAKWYEFVSLVLEAL